MIKPLKSKKRHANDKTLKGKNKKEFYQMTSNFYCVTFFGQIFNRNNLRSIKAWILRKEYFNKSSFCFLDFKIIFNLEKYFLEFIHVWKSILIFKIGNFSLKIYQLEHKLLNNSFTQSRYFYLIKIYSSFANVH